MKKYNCNQENFRPNTKELNRKTYKVMDLLAASGGDKGEDLLATSGRDKGEDLLAASEVA